MWWVKKELSKRTSRKRTKKKGKKHRKTSLTGFEPTTDQAELVKLSTAPRGIRRLLTAEELIFSLHGFSSNSSWLSDCIIPSKHVKNIKKRLVCGIFLFYTSRLQTSTMEQTFLNTSIFPRCTESRCTEKNQARSLMTSTHASVRCSILVFTDIRNIWQL